MASGRRKVALESAVDIGDVTLLASTAEIGKLGAGSAIIGQVGINQTTPGTTNAVAPISGQAGVAGGAGAVSATVQRVTLASDDPAVVALAAVNVGVKDNGPSWTSVWGVSDAPVASADMSSAAYVTDAPTAGQKLVLDDIILTNRTSGALECTLRCDTTNAIVIGPIQVPANSTVHIRPRGKRKLATADKRAHATWSASGNINVLIGYHSEA